MTTATIPAPRLGIAYLSAGAALLIWGATPTATKFVVGEFDPLMAAVLRTVVAAAFVLPFVIWFRMPLPTGRQDGLLLLVTSFTGFVGFTLLFSYGVQQTSAVHAAMINAGIPVFSGLFGAISERRIPGKLWLLGGGIACIGEVYLIFERGDGSGQATLFGDLLCVLSSACVAVGYVTGARLSRKYKAIHVTFWSLILAGVVQLPLLIWALQKGMLMDKSVFAWQGVLFLAILTTIVGYVCWYKALAEGGVVRMSVTQFIMPVVSVSMVVLILGEPFTLPVMISMLVIVSGIAITRLDKQ